MDTFVAVAEPAAYIIESPGSADCRKISQGHGNGGQRETIGPALKSLEQYDQA
ncbi:MAG: hypothetical protein ACP5NK_01295 [Thermoplasmata archaeon]